MRATVRILFLSLMLVFCSALMSSSLFVNSAYADGIEDDGANAGVTAVKESGSEVKTTPDASINAATGSGMDLGGAKCKAYNGNPFELIACKATTTLSDLRVIIYVIAGFGLIAFTFGAIFGKLNWKHLSQIGIGLFLVSMMTPFIEYFVGNDNYSLKFGNYLKPGEFKYEARIAGSNNSVERQACEGENCLDEVVTGDLEKDPLEANKVKDEAGKLAGNDNNNNGNNNNGPNINEMIEEPQEKEKFKLSDLKGTVNDTINAVKAGSSILNTAKASVKEAIHQKDKISSALKGLGSGGLKGIINSGQQVAESVAVIGDVAHRANKNLEHNTGVIADSAQTVGSTSSKREQLESDRSKGMATNKVNEALQKGGIGGVISDARDKAMQTKQDVGNAKQGGVQVGGALGDTAGGVVGVAGAIGNIANSSEKAKEREAMQAMKNPSNSDIYTDIFAPDGTRNITFRDGTVQSIAKDGSQTISYADGTVNRYDKKGKPLAPKETAPQSVSSVSFTEDGKMIYRDASGKEIGSAGYNKSILPAGAVGANVGANGSLEFYDAAGNRVY